MAGSLVFQDSPGHTYKVLPAGLVNASLDEFSAFFGNSSARQNILNHYLKFRERLDPLMPTATHLIDGSFVEDKIRPSDIDTVIFFNAADFNNIEDSQRKKIMNLIGPNNQSKYTYLTDAFAVPLAKPDEALYHQSWARLSYWLTWFGTSRGHTPKGIVRLVNQGTKDDLSNFLTNCGMEILQ